MKFSTKQVSLVPIRVSERTFRYEIRMKSWGIPDFGGIPVVMTSHSRKHVIISPKKSLKTRRREISPNYLCKKEQPSWKTEKLSHFEFLNLNISLLNGRQVLIF